MATKINYNNKVPFQTREDIPDENKVNAEDMNEIKTAVNANADELDAAKEDIESLQGGQDAASTEITSLKNRVSILESDNATNKTDISILKSDNETNKTNITKVKADITELEEKVSTLEEDNTQNKADIEDLQESQEQQDTKIGILMNALPSETQESENINIKGTIPVKFKEFKVSGNSKQETSDAMPSSEYPSEIQNVEGNVNVSVCNKNILNNVIENQTAAGVTVIKNEDGSITLNGTATSNAWVIVTENIMLSKGNNVLSLKNKIAGLGLYLGSSSNTDYAVTQSTTTEEKTFDLQENTIFDVVRLRVMEGTVFNNLTVYPMLEKNTMSTSYIKHQEQNILFPLAQGQKLMLGDYLASDGIHHVRKQMELDGTEDWALALTNTDTLTFQIVNNNLPVKIPNDNDEIVMISNYFKGFSRNQFNNDKETESISPNISNGSKAIIITINKTTAENLNDFKSWLAAQKQAGTPVIIEYELAEEEIEAYTEKQQEAYNQICNLKAYEEETNIFSTNETSPIFKVTAVKDVNSVITQLNQLILENGGN